MRPESPGKPAVKLSKRGIFWRDVILPVALMPILLWALWQLYMMIHGSNVPLQ